MTPLNRSLLVSVLEQEDEKQTAFYLPDDVVTGKKPFEVVEVVDVSSDSKFANKLSPGDKVVDEGHMLRKITVFGETATLIEDNYVLAKM
jgi:co-chaperonin GroES (HSP10)